MHMYPTAVHICAVIVVCTWRKTAAPFSEISGAAARRGMHERESNEGHELHVEKRDEKMETESANPMGKGDQQTTCSGTKK